MKKKRKWQVELVRKTIEHTTVTVEETDEIASQVEAAEFALDEIEGADEIASEVSRGETGWYIGCAYELKS